MLLALFPNCGRRFQELLRVWTGQLKAVTETTHGSKQTVRMLDDIIEAHERTDRIASFASSGVSLSQAECEAGLNLDFRKHATLCATVLCKSNRSVEVDLDPARFKFPRKEHLPCTRLIK